MLSMTVFGNFLRLNEYDKLVSFGKILTNVLSLRIFAVRNFGVKKWNLKTKKYFFSATV